MGMMSGMQDAKILQNQYLQKLLKSNNCNHMDLVKNADLCCLSYQQENAYQWQKLKHIMSIYKTFIYSKKTLENFAKKKAKQMIYEYQITCHRIKRNILKLELI